MNPPILLMRTLSMFDWSIVGTLASPLALPKTAPNTLLPNSSSKNLNILVQRVPS